MKKLLIASVLYASLLFTNASADTLALDGTYVSGDSAELAPDGTNEEHHQMNSILENRCGLL